MHYIWLHYIVLVFMLLYPSPGVNVTLSLSYCRYNVSLLQEWLHSRSLQTGGAVATLEPLIQAVQLLQVGKKTEADARALVQTCSALSSQQVGLRFISLKCKHTQTMCFLNCPGWFCWTDCEDSDPLHSSQWPWRKSYTELHSLCSGTSHSFNIKGFVSTLEEKFPSFFQNQL